MSKAILVSKTVWFNLITMLIMIFSYLQESPIVPPEFQPFVIFGVGLLNLILRIWFTDTTLKGLLPNRG